jgi:sugar phosphate isomerase/epimerase
MTILPGIDHLKRSLAENLAVSIDYLRKAVAIASEYGIVLRFEPHMSSIADTPELALQLVEAVPGLKVALDYAHFMLQYIPVERIHALIPHAGLIHVRQTRYGKLQVAHSEGIIDYPNIISRLKAIGYEGALVCEYVCADWFEVNRNDTLYETSVAREMLLPYIQ